MINTNIHLQSYFFIDSERNSYSVQWNQNHFDKDLSIAPRIHVRKIVVSSMKINVFNNSNTNGTTSSLQFRWLLLFQTIRFSKQIRRFFWCVYEGWSISLCQNDFGFHCSIQSAFCTFSDFHKNKISYAEYVTFIKYDFLRIIGLYCHYRVFTL